VIANDAEFGAVCWILLQLEDTLRAIDKVPETESPWPSRECQQALRKMTEANLGVLTLDAIEYVRSKGLPLEEITARGKRERERAPG
jgi:hypothetical protein